MSRPNSGGMTPSTRGVQLGARVSPSFRVFPPEVVFKDVQVNVVYYIRINVQNTSMVKKRVRILPPGQRCFNLKYTPLEGIAPGMEQIVELEFLAKDQKDVSDRLIVMSENEKIELPITVTFPVPDLQFDGFLNIGTVIVGQPQTVTFAIENAGMQTGDYKFQIEDPSLTIAPSYGFIEPLKKQEFKACLTAEKPGPFRQLVTLDIKNMPPRTLDVFATAVESRVELFTPDSSGILSVLEFGSLFVGDYHTASGILVNNSPVRCSFVIRPSKDDDDANDEDGEEVSGPVEAVPAEGVLEPYQQLNVQFILRAERKALQRGFKTTAAQALSEVIVYNGKMQIEIIETEQKVKFGYNGRAIPPRLDISEKRLVFGECPVNDHLDIMVTMKNLSDELPLDFQINSVPHFCVKPSNGKLLPLESQNVVFTFRPKQLGTFEHILNVSICHGLTKVPLRVSGSASVIGVKHKTIGGPDKIAEDFEPELKLVDPLAVSLRSTLVKTTDLLQSPKAEQFSTGVGVTYTIKESDALLDPDFLKTVDHHRRYNFFIRKGKNEDEVRDSQARFEAKFANETDIGLIPGEGLEAPRLDLPAANDPLWLEEPIEGTGMSRKSKSGTKRVQAFDENRIFKKKFKAHPTAPAEARECAMVLSPKELLLVNSGPKVIDFGVISVFTKVTKSFTVANNLKTAILVTVPYERDELSGSFPGSQVIPPGATAGFDIVLCSPMAQTFQQSVFFTVNGHHRLKFLLYAEIVPIDVRLSSEEVTFRFGDFSIERTVTESVSLTNTAGADTRYSWRNSSSDGVFVVEPSEGFIGAGQTAMARITYCPDVAASSAPGTVTSCELLLDVQGGLPRSLRCVGGVSEGKCKLSEKSLDFGIVPVGMSKKKTLKIKNVGENNAVFFVESTIPGVTISPPRGLIGIRSSQELQVTCKFAVPQNVDGKITLNIRGGKSLKLPIKADAQIPNVQITTATFNFGDVYVHGISRKKAVLRNSSAIPAILFLDFSEHRDFAITLADGSPVPDQDDAPICIARKSLSADDGGYGESRGSDGGSAPASASHAAKGVKFDNMEDDDDDDSDISSIDGEVSKRYKITIPPEDELSFFMVFSPSEVCVHDFELPLLLAGVPSAGSQLSRKVKANALPSRLSLSTTMVDFRNRVIFREEQLASGQERGHEMELQITSEEDKPMEWKFSPEALASVSSTFCVEPAEGFLMPRDTMTVKFYFSPKSNRQYNVVLPLLLIDAASGSSSVYAEVEVRGCGIHPMITFDQREVILPVVPLGFTSSTVFHVINEGYENLELKYRLPADTSRIPLSVRFPDGQVLDKTRLQIPVEISFVAKKPTSFTAKIDFFDNEGNKFSVSVSGTTDNSLCTVYPYVYANHDAVKIVAEHLADPAMLWERTQDELEALAKDKISSGISIHSGGLESEAESSVYGKTERFRKQLYSKRSLERVRTFLNVCVLRNPVQDVVSDFVRFDGEPLFDMVAFLSGKEKEKGKAPSSPGSPGSSTTQNTTRMEAVTALMQKYDDLLSFLKSHGALLNDVRSDFLLRYEDYLRVVVAREEAILASGMPLPVQQQRKLSEKRYLIRAAEAWTTIIYQVFKVFMLNRITAKTFAGVAGVPKEYSGLQDASLSQSNFLNSAESILLKWLSFHFNSICNKDAAVPGMPSATQEGHAPSAGDVVASSPAAPWKRMLNFDSDLRDSLVFASLIESHFPTLAKRFVGLRRMCRSREDLEHNASLVVSAMRDIGLDYIPEVRDIVSPNGRDMLLFVWYLFQNLPSFVPKATVEFDCLLLVPLTKMIELTNPTARILEFSVRLEHVNNEGSAANSAFSIADEKVRLEPKKSFNLPVTALCRFSKPAEARLTLFGRKVGQHVPTSMVFVLRTSVDSSHALKTISVESPTYDVKSLDIEVENPFNQTGRFSVMVSQSYLGLKTNDKSTAAVSAPRKAPQTGPRTGGMNKSSAVVGLVADKGGFSDRINFPDAFWTKVDRLQLKAGEKAKVPLQFLPFRNGEYECRIAFTDDQVGEFSYKVVATAGLPLPMQKSITKCEEKALSSATISVPFRNALLDKAMDSVGQRLKELKLRRKVPDILPSDQEVVYRVEYLSPFLTGPKELIVNKKVVSKPDEQSTSQPKSSSAPSRDQSQSKKSNATELDGTLQVEFKPQEAGTYTCRILLRSQFDVRMIEFEGKAISSGYRASLEFSVPARQSITQDIPLVNRTPNQDWVIQADLRGSYFSGPREVKVPRGSTVNYQLTFSPSWVCDISGELILSNPVTDDKMTFALRGTAEEPLAADHVVVDCKARQIVEYPLRVTELPLLQGQQKSANNAIFDVEMDLPFLKGEKLFKPSQMGGVYTFVVAPPRSGSYTGSIVFKDPQSEEYSWYTVEINAERAASEGTVRLQTPIRQAVVAEVSITNPFNSAVEFVVLLEGAGLVGEKKIVLDAGESAAYPLLYCPLFPGQAKGSISFSNDEFGEFWYDLILLADPAEDIVLPEFRCEIGARKSATIRIENPVGEEVVLRAASTNAQNFITRPEVLVLGPYEERTAEIEYCPSSILTAESGTVTYSNPAIGTWTYICHGMGLLPTVMEEISVASPVGRTTTQVATFRNPFPDARTFAVSIVSVASAGSDMDEFRPPSTSSTSTVSSFRSRLNTAASSSNAVPAAVDERVYQLLMRPTRQTLRAFSTLQIPISFTPSRMAEFKSVLVVEMVAASASASSADSAFDRESVSAQRLEWRFPIKGIAENTPSDRPFRFKCKSRTRMEENIEIVLPDLVQGGAQAQQQAVLREEFTHELIIPAQHSTVLNRALSIVPTVDLVVTRPNQPLKFHVTFVPLRPLRATIQLVILKKSGGRWKFDVDLEATPPDADDTILIEANMHKTESVCFRLTNIFPTPARFEARFTPESPLEFTVIPTSGMLAPFGAEDGTPFIVSYTASHYGKALSGILEVFTDEMEWRYEVRGCLPEYLPPQDVKTKIENRLPSTVETHLAQRSTQKRNFLLENLRRGPNGGPASAGGASSSNAPHADGSDIASGTVARDGSVVSRRSSRSGGTRTSRPLLP